MPKRPQFGFKGGSASAEKRLMHKQMLDDWDAIRAAVPEVDAQFIKDTREKLRCSRALFARRLCMNERTLEKWEQGRVKPNGQAAVLFLLVRHFPDTLERLRRIVNPKTKASKTTRHAINANAF